MGSIVERALLNRRRWADGAASVRLERTRGLLFFHFVTRGASSRVTRDRSRWHGVCARWREPLIIKLGLHGRGTFFFSNKVTRT